MHTGTFSIRKFSIPLLATLMSLLLAACQQDSGDSPATEAADKELTITGQLIYLQRIALPPNAVAKVQLQDVSLADAPAKVMAEQTQELQNRQVPIAFTLKVPAGELKPQNRYSVAARIEDGSGKLLWITDTHNAVDPAQTGTLDLGEVRLVPARVSE